MRGWSCTHGKVAPFFLFCFDIVLVLCYDVSVTIFGVDFLYGNRHSHRYDAFSIHFPPSNRLQHTDVDVPHFSKDNHSFVKGALHTIDRPYDKLDPWGFIDFLHHKIGTTHVAHHFDSTIPHYKAEKATDAIKESFPNMYLYDPTPIPQALWRIAKGCTSVEKRGGKWVWNNADVEHLL